MKTLEIGADTVSVRLTEFEMMVLAALVERGQRDVSVDAQDNAGIGQSINQVAMEFRSLLGHFELVDAEAL
jgi:hypothetical protein